MYACLKKLPAHIIKFDPFFPVQNKTVHTCKDLSLTMSAIILCSDSNGLGRLERGADCRCITCSCQLHWSRCYPIVPRMVLFLAWHDIVSCENNAFWRKKRVMDRFAIRRYTFDARFVSCENFGVRGIAQIFIFLYGNSEDADGGGRIRESR